MYIYIINVYIPKFFIRMLSLARKDEKSILVQIMFNGQKIMVTLIWIFMFYLFNGFILANVFELPHW